jgi:hypothetical protein
MESKNADTTSAQGMMSASSPPQDADVSSTSVRTRIAPPANSAPRNGSREVDSAEVNRLAQRYGREAQLALEGLLYWGIRWPFELMAALVAAGRKWEEEYYRPAPRRRVSLYDEETPSGRG